MTRLARNRTRVWIGAGAIIAMAIAIGVIAGGEPSSGTAGASLDASAKPIAAGLRSPDAGAEQAPEADAADEPELAIEGHIVEIRSTPAGADVKLSRRGESIGTTPHDLDIGDANVPITVWISRRGYHTRTVQIEPGATEPVEVSLRRKRAAPDPLETR